MTGTDWIDLRKPVVSGGSSGLSQTVINIIEQNTGTQVNKKVLHTELEWALGVPVRVRKWTDSGKTDQVYDVQITWLDGVPTTVLTNNLDDGIITTMTIAWLDGVPVAVSKVES